MQNYIEEVDNNFNVFFQETESNIVSVFEEMNKEKEHFKMSYRRLVSFQAWNSELINKIASDGTQGFFIESQNDVLMSHALARQGAWRVALMSLRSCIENTLFGLYYLDHPVELELWELGRHRLGFTEVLNYLSDHPKFINLPPKIIGIGALKTEYATLSKAVHGSSKLFRVTREGEIKGLNVVSHPDFGSWKCRERLTVTSLNMVLLTFFRDNLIGTSNPNLRKAISLSIPESWFSDIKTTYKVSLKKTS